MLATPFSLYAPSSRTLTGCSNIIPHVINIPTMQSFTGTSNYTQSKSYILSLTECLREFRNNSLWDIRQHALFCHKFCAHGLVTVNFRAALKYMFIK